MNETAANVRSGTARPVCWQGWRVRVPRRWNPVKLEGDAAAGYALFADPIRPRLGLRWQTPPGRAKAKFDPAAAVRAALRGEVGQLAADEATAAAAGGGDWASPVLYVEPDPPGRDVWVGFSPASGRLLTVVYHVHRREHPLASAVLPTLADEPADRASTWSVFDLTCVVPGGMALTGQRLNAGDLALSFADRRGAELTVRQIAVAHLALRRQPLARWVADQQQPLLKHYRRVAVDGELATATATATAVGRLARRRRYALAWHRPPTLATLAINDERRDRLVILHGTDESMLRVVAESVGTDGTGAPPIPSPFAGAAAFDATDGG